MAEFNELIKHFNKVRTYVRDFLSMGLNPVWIIRSLADALMIMNGGGSKAGLLIIFSMIMTPAIRNQLPSPWTVTEWTVTLYFMYGKAKALQITISCCTFFFWI